MRDDGDVQSYIFPFRRFERARVEEAVARMAAAVPEAALRLDDETADEAMGCYDVAFTLRGARERGGWLYFRSDPTGLAALDLDLGDIDDEAFDTAEGLADACCAALGGRPDWEEGAFEALLAQAEADVGTWAAARRHLEETYDATGDDPDLVALTWSWTDTERTQLVVVYPRVQLDENWLVFQSTMAPCAAVALADAFAYAEGLIGKLVVAGDAYALEIALPFDGLTPERMLAALVDVAADADNFEEQTLGTDLL